MRCGILCKFARLVAQLGENLAQPVFGGALFDVINQAERLQHLVNSLNIIRLD